MYPDPDPTTPTAKPASFPSSTPVTRRLRRYCSMRGPTPRVLPWPWPTPHQVPPTHTHTHTLPLSCLSHTLLPLTHSIVALSLIPSSLSPTLPPSSLTLTHSFLPTKPIIIPILHTLHPPSNSSSNPPHAPTPTPTPHSGFDGDLSVQHGGAGSAADAGAAASSGDHGSA